MILKTFKKSNILPLPFKSITSQLFDENTQLKSSNDFRITKIFFLGYFPDIWQNFSVTEQLFHDTKTKIEESSGMFQNIPFCSKLF